MLVYVISRGYNVLLFEGPGQAPRLYEALRAPKDFMFFTKEEGGEEHCQMGAILVSNARILDWLDDVITKRKSRKPRQ